jgi:hypothetical protein
MRLERTLPMLVLARHVEFAGVKLRVLHCRFLQLQHQVFAFDEEVTERFAVLFLVKFFEVVEFQVADSNIDRATASATLIPSTPADRMPPA